MTSNKSILSFGRIFKRRVLALKVWCRESRVGPETLDSELDESPLASHPPLDAEQGENKTEWP